MEVIEINATHYCANKKIVQDMYPCKVEQEHPNITISTMIDYMKIKYKNMEFCTNGSIALNNINLCSLKTSNYSLKGFEISFNGKIIKIGIGLASPNIDKNGNEYLVYSSKTITSDSIYFFRSFDTSNFSVIGTLYLGDQEKLIRMIHSCLVKLDCELQNIKEDFTEPENLKIKKEKIRIN